MYLNCENGDVLLYRLLNLLVVKLVHMINCIVGSNLMLLGSCQGLCIGLHLSIKANHATELFTVPEYR